MQFIALNNDALSQYIALSVAADELAIAEEKATLQNGR